MRNISVDIETYSDIDIRKSGAYKYALSDAFEIMLIAFAIDDGPVLVIDRCENTEEDQYLMGKFLELLYAEDVILHAYNAAFEYWCINRWLRLNGHKEIPVSKYRCTMAHGLYCGYTSGLGLTGEVLGIDQDKKKLKIGSSLIAKFCTPQKPTKTNPNRTRITYRDEPEKWNLFKTYCSNDVEAERAIEKKLSKWPMPPREQRLWELDVLANAYGAKVDMELVHGALEINDRENDLLVEEAKQISGLDNPNSVSQLMLWLNGELNRGEDSRIDTLRKSDIADLLSSGLPSKSAERMLEIRQQLGKTSCKKYDSIIAYACDDDRVRGLTQYYGANRSGRWAGRGIQIQNIPAPHIEPLDYARELVKDRDSEMLKLIFGNTSDTLSQLIRTAFIPSEGKSFAVADFSAIECRVVAWIADQQDVLDTFRNGGDIYCETASRMFGIPVVKNGINGQYRKQGKVATLACIAEGELVLTNNGEKPIETVTTDDLVWDGYDWVSHEGVVCNGTREVITYEGLTATKDHIVWVEGHDRPIRFGDAAAMSARLLRTGHRGSPIRLGRDHLAGKAVDVQRKARIQQAVCAGALHELLPRELDAYGQPNDREVARMPSLFATEDISEMAGETIRCRTATMPESAGPDVSGVRRPRNRVPIQNLGRRSEMGGKESWYPGQIAGARPNRHERSLRAGEYTVRYKSSKHRKPTEYSDIQMGSKVLAVHLRSGVEAAEPWLDERADHRTCETRSRDQNERLALNKRTTRVYDIRNAGRHHRYTVSGCLVHNCGYGGGKGAMINMGALKMGIPEEELPGLVDKWRRANPRIVKLWRDVEDAATDVILNGGTRRLNHGIVFRYEIDAETKQKFMTIQLPTGRKLFYVDPHMAPDIHYPERIGIHYWGMNQVTKKWCEIGSFGGKLTENITQAIARDVLGDVLLQLHKHGYLAVFHVHDEVIIEGDKDRINDVLGLLLGIMATTPSWAEGLPLKGAGFTSDFYTKD